MPLPPGVLSAMRLRFGTEAQAHPDGLARGTTLTFIRNPNQDGTRYAGLTWHVEFRLGLDEEQGDHSLEETVNVQVMKADVEYIKPTTFDQLIIDGCTYSCSGTMIDEGEHWWRLAFRSSKDRTRGMKEGR